MIFLLLVDFGSGSATSSCEGIWLIAFDAMVVCVEVALCQMVTFTTKDH